MIAEQKKVLLEQMEKQRFLPITEETPRLYDAYNAIIDTHNPDELSCLLFYKAEYFYRIGKFNESLNYLSRTLQAPKHNKFLRFNALSYNIMGRIYSSLNQEYIAINTLMLGKSLCESASLDYELALCCVTLGNVYSQLDDCTTAISYYDLAIEHLRTHESESSDMLLLCEVCRGILFCKTGKPEKALSIHEKIKDSWKQTSSPLYAAPVFNFNIRLYDVLQDKEFLTQNLELLLQCNTTAADFLEPSDWYFDIFMYLWQRNMQPEALALLQYIKKHVENSPLAFLKHRYLQCQIQYTQKFGSADEYQLACSQFMDLNPIYHREQQSAKLYSLEYVERIHQTKSKSEMFREKSQLDQMTGLLNKYTIEFFVEENLSTAAPGKHSAMILIDMDHFRQINDTLGHLAGDNFICQTAAVIQNYFNDNAFCGRIGGDEFLIYLPDVTDTSFVILQAEILRQEIYRKTSERNLTITTQASIGIAFSSEYCYNYESLFKVADQALYQAKLEGRNKVVVADQNIRF